MQEVNPIDIQQIIAIARQAGRLIMFIYNQLSFDISHKADTSVLTRADIESHTFIYESLQRLYPHIPIISEESEEYHDYQTRKTLEYFFLVDPLDGTKEFIKRNDEFTINIALIKNNKPILGIVYAPAIDVMYYAEHGKGAYKLVNNNEPIQLPRDTIRTHNQLRIAVSRSHACADTEAFINILQHRGNEVVTISSGSALKFGLIAEGNADIYPRFGPTMEWDTAAGHVIVNEVGKSVSLVNSDEVLSYNKQELVNPGFIVQ